MERRGGKLIYGPPVDFSWSQVKVMSQELYFDLNEKLPMNNNITIHKIKNFEKHKQNLIDLIFSMPQSLKMVLQKK